MKIAITGATGFIGQNLIPILIQNCPYIELLTLNRNVNKAEELFPSLIYSQCNHIHITEWEKLICFNPDVIFHLATISTARDDTNIISQMLNANIEFGVLLLNALSKCSNVKLFVNTGTFAEYRFGCENFDSAYLYAASKTAFRAFVEFYSKLAGFRYINIIPYSVYGGKMTIKRIMDYILESINSKEPINMTKGEQILDFIHVSDIARFYIYIINHIKDFCTLINNGENFHLGTGVGTSIREIVSIVEKQSSKKCNINWGGIPYRKNDIMYAVAPIGKTLSFTNWKAKIDINEGVNLVLKEKKII